LSGRKLPGLVVNADIDWCSAYNPTNAARRDEQPKQTLRNARVRLAYTTTVYRDLVAYAEVIGRESGQAASGPGEVCHVWSSGSWRPCIRQNEAVAKRKRLIGWPEFLRVAAPDWSINEIPI
jgi:hypothetical protein